MNIKIYSNFMVLITVHLVDVLLLPLPLLLLFFNRPNQFDYGSHHYIFNQLFVSLNHCFPIGKYFATKQSKPNHSTWSNTHFSGSFKHVDIINARASKTQMNSKGEPILFFHSLFVSFFFGHIWKKTKFVENICFCSIVNHSTCRRHTEKRETFSLSFMYAFRIIDMQISYGQMNIHSIRL